MTRSEEDIEQEGEITREMERLDNSTSELGVVVASLTKKLEKVLRGASPVPGMPGANTPKDVSTQTSLGASLRKNSDNVNQDVSNLRSLLNRLEL